MGGRIRESLASRLGLRLQHSIGPTYLQRLNDRLEPRPCVLDDEVDRDPARWSLVRVEQPEPFLEIANHESDLILHRRVHREGQQARRPGLHGFNGRQPLVLTGLGHRHLTVHLTKGNVGPNISFVLS